MFDVLLGAGSASLVGVYAYLLRRNAELVELQEDGVAVGTRLVRYDRLVRVSFANGVQGAWVRLFTPDGVVGFRDEQLAVHVVTAVNTIVERAGLEPDEPREMPTGVYMNPGDSYVEWAPAELLSPDDESTFNDLGDDDRRSVFDREDQGERHADDPLGIPDDLSEKGKKAGIGIAALLALLMKFGKSLLVGIQGLGGGLGQLWPTLVTMGVSVWAYAQLWTWRFGVGFVALLFVHEMGHAIVIRAKGLRTSPIVFVPFFGALITIKDQFRDAAVEAETAYGGPALGALGASACFVAWRATDYPFWLHLAYIGFLLNLFNLLPMSPMDGGRIVTAISTWLWVVGLGLAAVLGFMTGHPILLIIVLLGALRAWRTWKQHQKGPVAYFELAPAYRVFMACAYFGLVAYLALMTHHAMQIAGTLEA